MHMNTSLYWFTLLHLYVDPILFSLSTAYSTNSRLFISLSVYILMFVATLHHVVNNFASAGWGIFHRHWCLHPCSLSVCCSHESQNFLSIPCTSGRSQSYMHILRKKNLEMWMETCERSGQETRVWIFIHTEFKGDVEVFLFFFSTIWHNFPDILMSKS